MKDILCTLGFHRWAKWTLKDYYQFRDCELCAFHERRPILGHTDY